MHQSSGRGSGSLKSEDPFPKTHMTPGRIILQTVLWELTKSPLIPGRIIAVPETGYPTC